MENHHNNGFAGLIIGAILLTTFIILPTTASAVPAFARQANMPCTACHFQNFPTLNAFGRTFRAGGYTMTGGQGLIEGDDISIPAVLNASVIAKLRYKKTNGNTDAGSDRGSIEWPDEAALLIGGRLSKSAGFLMELGLADVAHDETNTKTITYLAPDPDDPNGPPITVTEEVLTDTESHSNSFLSTKIHFNVAEAGNTQFSIIPYSTDGLGSPYGFELLNTGAQRSQRPIEDRRGFSAAQALGLASGEATGLAFVASSSNYFLNYSPWVPGWGGTNMDVEPSGFTHYLRAAYMPFIGSWDTGFGLQYWTGDASVADDDGTDIDIKTDGWIIDTQAQGEVGGMPLGLYASYGQCEGDADHFAGNCGNSEDADAFGILAQLGIIPNKLNIYAAYRQMDVGKAADTDFDSWTIGANYLPAQNIRFELFYISESGSGVDARADETDGTLLLQLFAGF